MSIVTLKTINDAAFIQVQSVTIGREDISLELNILNQNSLNVLVGEYEAKRLSTNNPSALYLSVGKILNSDGSITVISSGSGSGTGGTTTNIDTDLRQEIGSRTTNYNNVFLDYLNQ